MKALVGAFNQEKALIGAFTVIVQAVVEPMDRFTALKFPDVSSVVLDITSLLLLCSHQQYNEILVLSRSLVLTLHSLLTVYGDVTFCRVDTLDSMSVHS